MDIPDRDIEAVAFCWDSFRTVKFGKKPWWQFWGSPPEVCVFDDFVWHYAKELSATPFSTFLYCHTQEQYRIALRCVDALAAEAINAPVITVALVPIVTVGAWSKRHRMLMISSSTQASDLDNLITLHGQPQEQ
jgi:hypothetical protein